MSKRENLEKTVREFHHTLQIGDRRIVIEGGDKTSLAKQIVDALREVYNIEQKEADCKSPKAQPAEDYDSAKKMLYSYFSMILPKYFVDALVHEEKILITLRDELYGGKWRRIEHDLENRKKGRPYVFKLVNRIEADINRIEMLRTYEKTHHINLRQYCQSSN